jgi:Tol biopolymer transport system component
VNGTLTVELLTAGGTVSLDGVAAGPIIHASRSPSGDWIAFRTAGELSGLDNVYAVRVADGQVVALARGMSVNGSPFSGELAWSPDGSLLGFTLRPEAGGTQVWLFSTAASAAAPLTAAGGAPWFAASFDRGSATALWVSTFDGSGSVASYRVPLPGTPSAEVDPTTVADRTLPGGFLPLVAADGSRDA